jgi:hypothetical protein
MPSQKEREHSRARLQGEHFLAQTALCHEAAHVPRQKVPQRPPSTGRQSRCAVLSKTGHLGQNIGTPPERTTSSSGI